MVQPSDASAPLVNTVVVTGTDIFATVVNDSDTVTVNIVAAVEPAPAIAVSKSANVSQASVGNTITYTYRITNTGNVTLATVSATDDQLGPIAALSGELAPEASRLATLTYVAQLGDVGVLVNTVTATATDIFATEVTDSDSVTVTVVDEEDAEPGIVVAVSVNITQAQVGDTITYTYRVTNTGNITLAISAEDDVLGVVTALAGHLLTNTTRSATPMYIVQAGDVPGPLVNNITVTATDPFGTVITASASASVITPPTEQQAGSIYLPHVEH